MGGFLVSGSMKSGKIQKIEIYSENNNELKIYNPWGKDVAVKLVLDGSEKGKIEGEILQLKVKMGQKILLKL
jgi:hypothetical protein